MIRTLLITGWILFISCNIMPLKSGHIISLEKTPCFGSCPIYKIEIDKNKNGKYHGIRFVDSIGIYSFNISESSYKEILVMSEEIGFSEISEKEYFDEYIQDLSSTIITINNHTVQYNQNINKDLMKLTDYIYLSSIQSISIKD